MRHTLPRTPFSSPFTTSKKMLEARIRNIIAGPQKRPPLPLLILVLAFCFFSVNLVSCQQRASKPQIVMDLQYYDIYNNYIEIPRLVLPEGANSNDGIEAINQRLELLQSYYSFLFEGNVGFDSPLDYVFGFENRCLLYPAITDRYISLLFFQDQFTTDLNSGHVLSLIYDMEEGRQVTMEDALALAELTEEELFAQLSRQIDPQIQAGLPDSLKGADIGIQNPALEGFRMAADGQPVFYLTARVDDADDTVNDAISGSENLYIWEKGVFTRYDQYAMGENLLPLIPAEECLDLDPPLWRQWRFADGVPEGGFTTPDAPSDSQSDPQSPGTDSPADDLNGLLLDYYRDYFFGDRPGTLYFAADMPDQPQAWDILLGPVEFIGSVPVYETEGVLYRIELYQYTAPDSVSADIWLHWPDDYVVVYRGQDGTFQGVAGSVSTSARLENASPEEIVWQIVWGVNNLEMTLFREGYPDPLSPGKPVTQFPEETPVTRRWPEEGTVIYADGDYWAWQDWDGLTTTGYYSASEDVFTPYIFDVTRTDMSTYRGVRVGQSRTEVLAAYPEVQDIDGVSFWGLETEGEDVLWYHAAGIDAASESLLFFFEGDTLSRIVMHFNSD